MIVSRALLPGLVVAAVLFGTSIVSARSAAAECPKPKGKPMYRVTRGPINAPPPGEATSVQTQTFEIFATGRWRWVGAGEAGSGEAMGQSGCISPAAMKEIDRAMSKARFRVASGIVTTCAALPIARVKYAALRRGRRVTTDEPCGIPLDKTTAALARCAEEAARATPPAIGELRKICRGLDD
ncbi:MAG TPA: hypothetical protein VM261_05170 [Kofleriaceae bacterium]|nr:hypothetical protein [Kofleriaceae bacterium]